ncbi:MAG: aminopeptidase [Vallitaleaceae bacterium]|jgi:aminopeptidase|nr:aminopeptidase [Vallitaleaceae bacterium]
MTDFQKKLQKYAELAVKVGVNLKEKESILITGNEATLPLVRLITAEAYKAGAKNIEFMLTDEDMTIARYENGRDYVFEEYPQWKIDAIEAMYIDGYQHMAVIATNPDLLKNIDSELVGKDSKVRSTATYPLMAYRMNGFTKWTIVAMPSEAWATKVFPEATPDEAIGLLWENIFTATRIDQEDPVAAWQKHNAFLKDKEAFLTSKQFEKLVYKGPGTDLEVYLGINHTWEGGASESTKGVDFMPNMPTEEVFTTPHYKKVNGTLKATKPLSYQGKLVEDFGFTFKDGKVVDYYAARGKEVLDNLVNTDDGSCYLGEVAIVPFDSPISNTGILFSNTLFDENASCHFALGMSYSKTFENGQNLSKEELEKLGANDSKIHVDFMVGSEELEITAYTKDGEAFKLFEKGNWAF